jgi:hypothetical protein
MVHDAHRRAFDVRELTICPERRKTFAAQVSPKEITDAGAGEPETDVSALAPLKNEQTLEQVGDGGGFDL